MEAQVEAAELQSVEAAQPRLRELESVDSVEAAELDSVAAAPAPDFVALAPDVALLQWAAVGEGLASTVVVVVVDVDSVDIVEVVVEVEAVGLAAVDIAADVVE